METKVLPARDPFAIPHALDILRNGGLVAFPTDTVYGLAVLAFNARDIERLYVAKGRNHSKAIAILLSDHSQLPKVAKKVSPAAMKLAERFWPGPLTMIVLRHPDVPDEISPLNTVGVRVPDHPVALRLLELAGPLAVTSANISGKDSPTTAYGVLAQMKGRFHLLLDGGRTPGGTPSTVVDCTGHEPVILRPGPVTLKDIKNVLGG